VALNLKNVVCLPSCSIVKQTNAIMVIFWTVVKFVLMLQENIITNPYCTL